MLDMQQGLVYYPHTCGTRYHLKEFRGTREPQNPKELFNHRHSSLRTTVERAFGTLKNRFKIFKSQPFFPLKTQVKIVMACCALHNWILQDGPDDYVYDDAAWSQPCLEVLEIVLICTRKMWHGLEKEMTWLKGCGKIK